MQNIAPHAMFFLEIDGSRTRVEYLIDLTPLH
jgi:hypothetical protein